MSSMFCFQCEQTAGGKGCTKAGVCGKSAEVSNGQDELTCALVGLARAAEKTVPTGNTDELMLEGLFTTITNVNFDKDRVDDVTRRVREEKARLGGAEDLQADRLWTGDEDIVSLRSTLLLGLRGMAAYAYHAFVLGREDREVTAWIYKGMRAIGQEHSVEEWLDLLMEFGHVNSGVWPCWTARTQANSDILCRRRFPGCGEGTVYRSQRP